MKALACILSSILLTVSAYAWTPPIGIPAPNWGGTVGNPIETPAPKPPENWTSNLPNVYFVQSGGTNPGTGYPGNPRGEIPRILPAGTVVFLDGTYTKIHSPAYLHPNGTPEAPVWITSYDPANPAKCTGEWVFFYDPTYHCNYLIVDGINWDLSVTGGSPITIGGSVHHMCFRGGSAKGPGKSDPDDPNYTSGDSEFNHSTIAVSSSGSLDVLPTEQIVFSGMNISHGGNWQYAAGDPDAQGIAVAPTTQDVWIVDCVFSYFSGCAVQFGTGTTGFLPDSAAGRRMYLGRNVAHHIAQTAFWTKRSIDCIMSQNTAYTIRRDTPSSPNAGGFGAQYGPNNLWIIYNTVHDAQCGMGFGSSDRPAGTIETPIYLIGNVIYDIHDKQGAMDDWRGNPHSGGGTAILLRSGNDHYIINNTIAGYDAGILSPIIGHNRFIEGNIFSNRNGAVSGGEIILTGDAGGLNTFKNNIIQEVAGGCYIQNLDSIYKSVSVLNAAKGQGNIATAPTYINAGAGNYALAEGSNGVDAFGATAHKVYDLFQSKYGRSINADRNGGARPFNSAWDIGAYEFGAVGAPESPTVVPEPPPGQPKGIKARPK